MAERKENLLPLWEETRRDQVAHVLVYIGAGLMQDEARKLRIEAIKAHQQKLEKLLE
jgi:hypothetical protein